MSGLTMLLADDESIELSLLAAFIRESLPQIDVVETAGNGLELMAKAESLRPDILMVDVEMPGISGLESIGLLRKRNISGRIIIYSAYNYFEYAREAIDLRVDAYVLKPVRRAELSRILSETAERARTDKALAQELQQARKIVSGATPLLEAEFMRAVMFDDMKSESLAKCAEMLSLRSVCGCVVTFSSQGTTALSVDLRSILKAKAPEALRVIAGPVVCGHLSLCLLLDDDPGDETIFQRCGDWGARMVEYALASYRTVLRFSFGAPCRSLADLPASYRLSVAAEADIRPEAAPITDPFLRDEGTIMSFVLGRNEREAVDHVRGLFGEMSLSSVPVLSAQQMAGDFMLRAWASLRHPASRDQATQSALAYSLESLGQCDTLAAVLGWTMENLHRIIAVFADEKLSPTAFYLREAQKFIYANYQRPIGLDEVAEAVGISPFYLSHLFKQELDTTFLRFLTDFRMQTAWRLHDKTSLPIARLAELVGYKNVAYFSRVFQAYEAKRSSRP
jgi:two-component system response regulator YesN